MLKSRHSCLASRTMNKWLIGLIIAAVVLPLLIFVGNLKVTVPEGGLDAAEAPVQQYEEAQPVAAEGNFPAAPELAGIAEWINSEPLKLADLQGNVVLVDIWTYTCINCIRTLPYITSWHGKYGDKGLVIIGVHSPEFEFEKDRNNVEQAMEKYSIKYPVALDNDHATWAAFKNRYWPHKYLIDLDGKIRYDHIGEGSYAETENAIQQLLRERALRMEQNLTIPTEVSSPSDAIGVNFTSIATPEIYLGYGFARANLGNDEGFRPGEVVNYTLPASPAGLVPNLAYVGGSWRNNPDNLELTSGEGRILLSYTAKAVNIVAGQGQQPSALSVLVDGVPVNSTNMGSDVQAGRANATIVDEQRLYNLVMDQQGYQARTIEISVKGAGFRIYTFTFG